MDRIYFIKVIELSINVPTLTGYIIEAKKVLLELGIDYNGCTFITPDSYVMNGEVHLIKDE